MKKPDLDKIDEALGHAISFTQDPAFMSMVSSMVKNGFAAREYMPSRADDVRFVIISGHLLIEKLFEDFVKGMLKRPEHIEGKEINYRQLVAFARAMRSDKDETLGEWAYKATKKLAELRDMYAHNLAPHDAEKKIDAFVKAVEDHKQFEVHYEGKHAKIASAIVTLSTLIAADLSLSESTKARIVSGAG